MVIEEYSQLFEQFRVIYDEDKKWDVDAFSAKKPTFNDFRSKMNMVKLWFDQIERMQVSDFKGIYKVTGVTGLRTCFEEEQA